MQQHKIMRQTKIKMSEIPEIVDQRFNRGQDFDIVWKDIDTVSLLKRCPSLLGVGCFTFNNCNNWNGLCWIESVFQGFRLVTYEMYKKWLPFSRNSLITADKKSPNNISLIVFSCDKIWGWRYVAPIKSCDFFKSFGRGMYSFWWHFLLFPLYDIP